MQANDLQTTNDRFLISIDKDSVDKEFVLNLIEKIRLEHLVRKADLTGAKLTGVTLSGSKVHKPYTKGIDFDWWEREGGTVVTI